MSQKIYDLEERTLEFAKKTRILIKKLPVNIVNIEDCKQVARSSGSIGANYIEANESLSKKDFCYRIKICRKEAKETVYWLKLIQYTNFGYENEVEILTKESEELKRIFSAIIEKTK